MNAADYLRERTTDKGCFVKNEIKIVEFTYSPNGEKLEFALFS